MNILRTQATTPAQEETPSPAPKIDLKATAKTYQVYVASLKMFESAEPAQWRRADETLRHLPEQFWTHDKSELADALKADAAGVAARQELARRGHVYELADTFAGPYDERQWRQSFDELRGLGDSAVAYAAEMLMRQLLSPHRGDVWEFVRFYLVETGDVGCEMVKAFYQELSKQAAAVAGGVVFVREDEATQALEALIAFGDLGRPTVRGAAAHSSLTIRRAAARAAGASSDPTCLDLLIALSRDASPEVRGAAYEAFGKMRYSRERAGELLMDALAAERDVTAREQVLTALGDLRVRAAVPLLMSHLTAAENEWDRLMAEIADLSRTIKSRDMWRDPRSRNRLNAAQDVKNHYLEPCTVALWKITGQRHKKPADWRAWWDKNRATWK